jgi:protein gp37
VVLIEDKLDEPLRWKKPRRIFVNSMSDLFHESLTDEQIDRVFAVMAIGSQHVYQVLTKRPERMLAYLTNDGRAGDIASHGGRYVNKGLEFHWPLPNVWLGTSVEDQKTADERIPLLLETPAAIRWVSYEPALGPADLNNYLYTRFLEGGARHMYNQLDWLVCGGESGPNARGFDIAWARSIIAQCKAAGVAVFMKQIGRRPVSTQKEQRPWEPLFHDAHGRRPTGEYAIVLKDKKGGDWNEWPEDLRVREFPEAR